MTHISVPSNRAGWVCTLFAALHLQLALWTSHAVADPDHVADTANWLQLPVSSIDGFFPTPWACGDTAPNPQNILQFHRNWHCTNPDRGTADWGRRFFGFHRQFLQGYDRYLASIGETYVQTWLAGQGAQIPVQHGTRPKNAPCSTCLDLDKSFKVPAVGGTLDTFTSVADIGAAIVGWHNSNHGRIATSSCSGSCGSDSTLLCGDMNCPRTSPRDPIFYRYHHIFDDVQNAWYTLQPVDIAIVLDRSGSMTSPSTANGPLSKLDAAKAAAGLFADLLEDGSSHKLGMVSFSTTASNPPDMPLTDASGAPAALSAALAGVHAGGLTSIGDGLEKATTLINGGAEKRKAILLMTDGIENTAPMIADAIPGLGDTHVCSVGFGAPWDLDGAKLQALSESQGGIYSSTVNDLELKKFFVFCFANIFDTFVGEDPFHTLPAHDLSSAPLVHHALLDEKITFVLSWNSTNPAADLRLAITTPSGSTLHLDSPGVQSRVGPSWHVVKVTKLPVYSERDGDWTVRAVRPIDTYVNGFTSRSFANASQGVQLVQNEIATLCPQGCNRTLYYEDFCEGADTFEAMTSIYASVIFGQTNLGTITRPANASAFAEALDRGNFDLLVYSAQYNNSVQPYDGVLTSLLCGGGFKAIISEGRTVSSASSILRCAGAIKTGGYGNYTGNFTSILPSTSQLLNGPANLQAPSCVIAPSYSLQPAKQANSSIEATFDSGVPAVIAVGKTGIDEDYFITILARSTGYLKPFLHRNNTYTLEPLVPTFHIPSTHWPDCGYSRINATVDVTRPLVSLAKILSQSSSNSTQKYSNTTITTPGNTTTSDASPRSNLIAALPNGPPVIATETTTFPLYDDGTHGDTTADDHYFAIALPPSYTAIDGEYALHAHFTLCQTSPCGKETCVRREAQQTITIISSIDGAGTSVVVTDVSGGYGYGRRTKVVGIRPVDADGTPLGPGLGGYLVVTTEGGAVVEGPVVDWDWRGTYEVRVSYEETGYGSPAVTVGVYGRTGVRVALA
ncbi:hypothetical protein CONLIGDRAFT_642190 [Coniochaeta ligniaria NRRL 30616]|uniref:VWFA domain-containing protein n=1 Tax=Coniochaeta ligniaria NRRL 30616 TaxID=1408157 RepID=A0A1J7JXF8_9PEZI|nr:hypothetical protein CONLIGDRAFT_642190 [Coniochaeta ligniaria NRRL 30616]